MADAPTQGRQLKAFESAVVALLELHSGAELVVASGCTLLSRIQYGLTVEPQAEHEGADVDSEARTDSESDTAGLASASRVVVSAVAAEVGGRVAPMPSPLPLNRLLQAMEAVIAEFPDRLEPVLSAVLVTHMALESLQRETEAEVDSEKRDLYAARCRQLLPPLVSVLGTFGDNARFCGVVLRFFIFLFATGERDVMTGRMGEAAQALGPLVARALTTHAGAWMLRIPW
jgi:hypothetical protein